MVRAFAFSAVATALAATPLAATPLAATPLAATPLAAQAQAARAGWVTAGRTEIQLPDTAAMAPAAREILALERERSAAIASHDTATLTRIYADDFRGVTALGAAVDRARLLEVFALDDARSHFEIDELAVRAFGDAATVTGRLRTFRDGALRGESRYLHVWIRRGGAWRIVAAEGTLVGRPSPG